MQTPKLVPIPFPCLQVLSSSISFLGWYCSHPPVPCLKTRKSTEGDLGGEDLQEKTLNLYIITIYNKMGNNEMKSISKPAILWGNPMTSPFRTRTFITAWWWLEHEWIMTVPFSWECHHPTDELTFTPSFFRGVGQPPTREFIVKHPIYSEFFH